MDTATEWPQSGLETVLKGIYVSWRGRGRKDHKDGVTIRHSFS